MKQILAIIFCVTFVNSYAQEQGKIRDGFNTDSFPTISFVWHDYSPDILSETDFQYLKESGENRDFGFARLQHDKKQSNRTILVLWEDMAGHGTGQWDFTKNTLLGFFDEANISSYDKFGIAVFNRRKNNPSALTHLTNGFIQEKSQISDAIRGYRRSTETYPDFPNRSDMYTALREGLDLLQSLKEENVKAIFVFTAGYSMKNSGSDSEPQVLLKAQQLHIPVYVIEYFFKTGLASEPENFAKSTYGQFLYFKEVSEAKNSLKDVYANISERYYGQDYRISFTTKAKRGDETRMISFKIRGVEQQEQLTPPPFSLIKWIRENIWLAITIVIAILAMIVITIFFIIKKQKEKETQRQAKMAELAAKQQATANAAKQAAKQAEEDLLNYKKTEELKILQVEQERLANLMRTKNLYPRLQCKVGDNTFVYNVSQTITMIGRNEDNNLLLPHKTVSGKHAEIVFTENGFEIHDLGSTNKVIINGQFIEHATLKNADIIGLGEAIITFYL